MGEWRAIPGFGRYRACDDGRVMNARTARVLKPVRRRSGYLEVRIPPDGGKTKNCLVHRLVATAFRGPPPDGYVCDHVNGDKQDNSSGNLEWVTRAENNKRAAEMGLYRGRWTGRRNPNAKLTDEAVADMRRQARAGETYTRLAEAAGVSVTTAYNAVRGNTWSHVAEPALAV
jgi:hypothetical protein